VRIEQVSPRLWAVHVEPNELELTATRRYPYSSLIGFINERGTLRTSGPAGAPRGFSRAARALLERARRQLWESGALRNRPEERWKREEARTGTFIALLDTGETRRFHSSARANEWLDDSLKRGPAHVGELYHDSGLYQHEPFDISVRNEYGHVTRNIPASLRRAFAARHHANEMSHSPPWAPTSARTDEKADAWEVAADALEEVGLRAQAKRANAQAAHWRKRSRVKSRDPRRRRMPR
jgi:hypothetical protein